MKKLLLIIFFAIALFPLRSSAALPLLYPEEIKCVTQYGFYRLQVPIIGCTPGPGVCCSNDGIYTIGLKGLPSFVTTAFRFGVIAIIVMMVLILMIAGIQYIVSFGDPEGVKGSITKVKHAAMGLVVILFSTVILYQINPNLISLSLEGIANINPPEPTPVAGLCCQKKTIAAGTAPESLGYASGEGTTTTMPAAVAPKASYYYGSKKDDAGKAVCESGDEQVDIKLCADAIQIVGVCETSGQVRVAGESYTFRDLQLPATLAKTNNGTAVSATIDAALAAVSPNSRITKDVVAAIISQESSGDAKKVASTADADGKLAYGLMQVKLSTAQQICPSDGIGSEADLQDPLKGTKCGIRILNDYLTRTGTLRGAVAAYNTGIITTKACAGMKNGCGNQVFGWECLYDLQPDGTRTPNYLRAGNQKNTRDYVSNVMSAINYCPDVKKACQ